MPDRSRRFFAPPPVQSVIDAQWVVSCYGNTDALNEFVESTTYSQIRWGIGALLSPGIQLQQSILHSTRGPRRWWFLGWLRQIREEQYV